MKITAAGLFTTLIFGLVFSTSASAVLIDRGNGMIYDTDQDLTWLQDANYAVTSGYASANAVNNGNATDNIFTDGRMGWDAAMSWAANLNYGGYDDWRLPSATDIGNDGCNWSYIGSDCGANVDTATSELAYMWHDNLGNISRVGISGWQSGGGLTSTSADGVDILNLQLGIYWSDTESVFVSGYAWYFNVWHGEKVVSPFSAEYYAWAVRAGDVGAAPVPAPAMFLLLVMGLAGMVGANRRLRNKAA